MKRATSKQERVLFGWAIWNPEGSGPGQPWWYGVYWFGGDLPDHVNAMRTAVFRTRAAARSAAYAKRLGRNGIVKRVAITITVAPRRTRAEGKAHE